jgi:saccharopine dehydrogenase-like NADP-dependent oxidoreductase
MKACIVGVGDMGLPTAWAMKRLGFELDLFETNHGLFDCIEAVLGARPRCGETISISPDCDVVISCVPYIFTTDVAEACAKFGIPYCDLGGNPEVSQNIQKTYGAKIAVFTDLGLAPGFLNILAESVVANNHPNSVFLKCGGLPLDPTGNRLNYARVFNVEGLTNEYSGMCDIIEDGSIKQVPALSGLENFTSLGYDFECFHTKGASNGSLSSMLDQGVKNFFYKTVRFRGHADYIKFLMEDCKIVGKEFSQAIINACPKTKRDQVFLEISTEKDTVSLMIVSDEQWTAMQKGTAFPTAAVAAILASHKSPNVWSYRDVPQDEFRNNLNSICGEELII